MKRVALLLALAVSCVHNTQDSHREAALIFVSGKASLCNQAPSALDFGKPATGRKIQLATANRVLAEDVVGPDGSYVLHPKAAFDVSEPVYLVAGNKRITLANNYASWIQDHLSYRYDVRFGCGEDVTVPAPASAARSDEATPSQAPSPQLFPTQ